jgi:hypothetical protein
LSGSSLILFLDGRDFGGLILRFHPLSGRQHNVLPYALFRNSCTSCGIASRTVRTRRTPNVATVDEIRMFVCPVTSASVTVRLPPESSAVLDLAGDACQPVFTSEADEGCIFPAPDSFVAVVCAA